MHFCIKKKKKNTYISVLCIIVTNKSSHTVHFRMWLWIANAGHILPSMAFFLHLQFLECEVQKAQPKQSGLAC